MVKSLETIRISCYFFERKASRQIFSVFDSVMNESINNVHDTHAIATHGIGYTLPPSTRLTAGGLTPYPPKNFKKGY